MGDFSRGLLVTIALVLSAFFVAMLIMEPSYEEVVHPSNSSVQEGVSQ